MRGKSRRLPWLLLWPWSLFTTVILYPSLCSSLFLSSGWIAKWRLTSSDPCLVKLLARLNRKAANEKIHIVHLDPGVRSQKILSVSSCTYFGKLLCDGCMPLMALITYWQQHAAIILWEPEPLSATTCNYTLQETLAQWQELCPTSSPSSHILRTLLHEWHKRQVRRCPVTNPENSNLWL